LTVFWVDRGIDTGPILLQREVEIGPNETTGSVYFNSLFPMGVEAMVEAVRLIREGIAPRIVQDESKATYEPPCDDRVALVRFDKPGREIYNLIRGCDPQPGAFTSLKGKRVRFYDASFQPGSTGKTPGETVSIDTNGVCIASRDGLIRTGKLRLEKADKAGGEEFARLAGLKIGDRFGE
jgi:methionyl-tRNA formyltransferase